MSSTAINVGQTFSAKAVEPAPPDSHYGVRAAFRDDKVPDKVDVIIGAFRDDNGKPWILPSIRKAEAKYQEDPHRDNEYLPILGIPEFISATQRLILGGQSPAIEDGRVCSAQTISGTGAVHLGALFLSKFWERFHHEVYISDPTWDNHVRIFENVGLSVKRYPYLNPSTGSFDLASMTKTLARAPRGSVVVLQPCAHNPSGVDPSPEEWRKIAQVVADTALIPFFDCAYQGFATGSLDRDAFAIRYFVEQGIEALVAQSFSKNMGLYGQRVGCLHYVVAPHSGFKDATAAVASQLSHLQRSEISNPPIYGAKLASLVLNDADLYSEWQHDLVTMAQRIKNMRKALRERLEGLDTPGSWDHITSQIGMFSYTGLSKDQVMQLREKWHVYMLSNGRISVAGLNFGNITYFARAVSDVVKGSA